MAVAREIKVGAFVLAGLIVVGLVIFMIGEERQLFSSRVEYRTSFEDVEGLRRGSPVRMGGVDVGAVSRVAYSEDPRDTTIYVILSVNESESKRIRKDSRATIDSKGLLGDKMVVVTVGKPSQPRLEPGSVIPSERGADITAMVSRLGELTTKIETVVSNIERTTGALADEQFHKDLKSSAHSMSNILRSLDEGDGYVARLLHDPAEANKISHMMSNFEKTSSDVASMSSGVNQIVTRVKTGPGFAHEVVYGEDGSKALAQLGGAAEEVGTALRGIRQGNGVARSLIYGDSESQRMMANLNDASEDIKKIIADVRAGKGTIGAMLLDPSVYEDIKMLLGNVERNKTLRALVRYSIKRDEKVRGVEVRDPRPAAGVSPDGSRQAP